MFVAFLGVLSIAVAVWNAPQALASLGPLWRANASPLASFVGVMAVLTWGTGGCTLSWGVFRVHAEWSRRFTATRDGRVLIAVGAIALTICLGLELLPRVDAPHGPPRPISVSVFNWVDRMKMAVCLGVPLVTALLAVISVSAGKAVSREAFGGN